MRLRVAFELRLYKTHVILMILDVEFLNAFKSIGQTKETQRVRKDNVYEFNFYNCEFGSVLSMLKTDAEIIEEAQEQHNCCKVYVYELNPCKCVFVIF